MGSSDKEASVIQVAEKSEATFVEDVEVKETRQAEGDYIVATYKSYSPEFSAKVEKQLVRTIDLRIMPLIITIYFFNYLDRNSITQARLYGLQKDTHVHGAVYQTAISLFNVGYLFMQLPSTLLMTKSRPSLFLSLTMVVWAIVSGLTATASSSAGLLVLRFMLGVVEAPFYPSAIFFLSCWYTKKELGKRMTLLYSGHLISNAFAGVISAGILRGMEGVGHLASWRWLFILEALATLLIVLFALFFLPDYPATTKWLTEEQRIVALGRLAQDAGSEETVDEKMPLMMGVKLAARDSRVWMFMVLHLFSSASGSYSRFFPTLVKSLGFTKTKALLLTSPPQIFAFVWALSLATIADAKLVRSKPALVSATMAIIGAAVQVALPVHQRWARYFFTYFVVAGTFGISSTIYTWLSSTIIRPPVKRAAAIGIIQSSVSIAGLVDTYFWLDNFAPTFRVSWSCSLGFMVLCFLAILTLRRVLQKGNERFEKLAAQVDPRDEVAIRLLDEEERRAVLHGFRYIT